MDWRISNQMDYLFQAKLKHMDYAERASKTDHDHCEFCMDKFSDRPDDLHIGYCTADEYYWICEECFTDFAEMFEWRV